MFKKPENPIRKPEPKKTELIKASPRIKRELKELLEMLEPSDDEPRFNVITHNIVLDDRDYAP